MIRDSIEGVSLLPLPGFHLESVDLVGSRPSFSLDDILCTHYLFKPSYSDLYSLPPEETTLLDEEIKDLPGDGSIKLETDAMIDACASARLMLLGSTFLPSPIVEFVLEKVIMCLCKVMSHKLVSKYSEACLNFKVCPYCLKYETKMWQRRIVERIYFLKFEEATLSNIN